MKEYIGIIIDYVQYGKQYKIGKLDEVINELNSHLYHNPHGKCQIYELGNKIETEICQEDVFRTIREGTRGIIIIK